MRPTRSAAARQGEGCPSNVPVGSAPPLSRPANEALVYFGAGLSTIVCLMTLWIAWPTAKGPANDFLAFYTGAVLVGSGGLYDLEANRAVQREITGTSFDNLRFIRMPIHAAVLRPLTLLSYSDARIVFALLSMLAAAGVAWHVRRPWQLAAAAVSFFPLWVSIFLGQDVVFLLLACLTSLALHRRRHDWAAGLVLSLCLVKFHLFFLAPLILLGHRRWRYLGGTVAGAALWLGISTLTAGPSWLREYLAAVQSPPVSPNPERMPNVYGVFSGPLVWVAMVVILAAFAHALARCRDFETAFGIALAGGVMLSIHCYIYDCALFIPALVSAIRGGRTVSRGIAMFLMTPVPYLFLLWGYGLIVLIPGVLLGAVLAHEPRYFQDPREES